VLFSLDGQRLASGSADGTVNVRDAQSGQESFLLKGHMIPVSGVKFSEDSKRLVSHDEMGEVRSWNVGSGTPVVPGTDPSPQNDKNPAFSRDGSLRATIEGVNVRIVRTEDNRSPPRVGLCGTAQ
jgi:WD40 repeat protein